MHRSWEAGAGDFAREFICGWSIVGGTTSYEIENYNSLPNQKEEEKTDTRNTW